MSDLETNRLSDEEEFDGAGELIEIIEAEVEEEVEMKRPAESTSLRKKVEGLKSLGRGLFDYVIARAKTDTIIDALREIDKSRSWYDAMPAEQRNMLEELADELHYEISLRAVYVLQASALKAAEIKVEGLKSGDPKLRQRVASEILDRAVGKPDSHVFLAGKVSIGWDIPWKNG